MRSAGFTLIELLVVISIIGILSVMGYANYKDFAANQVGVKAVRELQTYLRLAQSNATTSTVCNGQGAISWSLKFVDSSKIELHCSKQIEPTDNKISTLILENATLLITGDNICPAGGIGFPVTLTYLTGVGTQSLTSSDINVIQTCKDSPTFIFTITNLKNGKTQIFKITKGGAIDVR